jgi:hypothetical protein
LHEANTRAYSGTDERLSATNAKGFTQQGEENDEGNSRKPPDPCGANPARESHNKGSVKEALGYRNVRLQSAFACFKQVRS